MRLTFLWNDARLRELIRQMRSGLFERAVAAGIKASLLWAVRDVTKNRLLGQYLRRRTGTLIRSITASPHLPVVSPDLVVGRFGSHLDYARAHELGFEGFVDVPEHSRASHRVRAHSRQTRAGEIQVRAHTRAEHLVGAHRAYLVIRARHFLRDTVQDAAGPTERRLARALAIAIRTGRVASAGELDAAL